MGNISRVKKEIIEGTLALDDIKDLIVYHVLGEENPELYTINIRYNATTAEFLAFQLERSYNA